MILKKYFQLLFVFIFVAFIFSSHQAFADTTWQTFTRNLSVGSSGLDVLELQQYLNSQGFFVAADGPGSPGNETEYFGAATKAALTHYQEHFNTDILAPSGLTIGTGNFFTSTRAFINTHFPTEALDPVSKSVAHHRGGAPLVISSYGVGGTVSGLSGTGLVLQNNGADILSIIANGSFTFEKSVTAGGTYNVIVKTNPISPNQTCDVSNGSGTVQGGSISNISVTCTTNTHTVTPSGDTHESITPNSSQAINDGDTESFTVAANSGYTLSNTVSGTCPAGSWSSNTYTTGAITADCSVSFSAALSQYTIGGNVNGLIGGGLVIQLNGAHTLNINSNGPFTFDAEDHTGGFYVGNIQSQPTSPDVTCSVMNGSGTVGSSDVTNVSVVCLSLS